MIRSKLSLLLACVLGIQANPVSAQNADALRERLQRTPPGTEIEVKLRSGETVAGQLAEVEDSFFALSISPDEETRDRLGLEAGSSLKRRISYGDVRGVKEQLDIANTFAELQGRIKKGDTVRVTTSSGEVFKSRVCGFLSDGAILSLGLRDEESIDLTEADIQTIELEIRDRLWDGPLEGFLLGVGVGALLLLNDPQYGEPAPAAMVFLGGFWRRYRLPGRHCQGQATTTSILIRTADIFATGQAATDSEQ